MCNCTRNAFTRSKIQSTQTNTFNIQLKGIWERVIKNEGVAKQDLIKLYLEKFPNNKRMTLDLSIQNLHKLYIQLANN